MRRFTIAIAALLFATPAAAEVVSSGPNHFHVRHSVAIEGDPAAAFAMLRRPAEWWSDAHSYSGDASNFRLELQPGGCLCETWDGGFVKHMEVLTMRPGTQIVMQGGLGPLLYAPASGVMVWEIANDEAGLRMVVDYKVTGFPAGNGEAMAVAVDGVLVEQATRFGAAVVRSGN